MNLIYINKCLKSQYLADFCWQECERPKSMKNKTLERSQSIKRFMELKLPFWMTSQVNLFSYVHFHHISWEKLDFFISRWYFNSGVSIVIDLNVIRRSKNNVRKMMIQITLMCLCREKLSEFFQSFFGEEVSIPVTALYKIRWWWYLAE